jgi:hypothetical protein
LAQRLRNPHPFNPGNTGRCAAPRPPSGTGRDRGVLVDQGSLGCVWLCPNLTATDAVFKADIQAPAHRGCKFSGAPEAGRRGVTRPLHNSCWGPCLRPCLYRVSPQPRSAAAPPPKAALLGEASQVTSSRVSREIQAPTHRTGAPVLTTDPSTILSLLRRAQGPRSQLSHTCRMHVPASCRNHGCSVALSGPLGLEGRTTRPLHSGWSHRG